MYKSTSESPTAAETYGYMSHRIKGGTTPKTFSGASSWKIGPLTYQLLPTSLSWVDRFITVTFSSTGSQQNFKNKFLIISNRLQDLHLICSNIPIQATVLTVRIILWIIATFGSDIEQSSSRPENLDQLTVKYIPCIKIISYECTRIMCSLTIC